MALRGRVPSDRVCLHNVTQYRDSHRYPHAVDVGAQRGAGLWNRLISHADRDRLIEGPAIVLLGNTKVWTGGYVSTWDVAPGRATSGALVDADRFRRAWRPWWRSMFSRLYGM